MSKPKPNLLIDARMIAGTPHGIGRYVTRLAEGLSLLQPLPYHPVFLRVPEAPAETFAGFDTIALRVPFLNPIELVRIPIVTRQARAEVFHSPSFASFPGLGCPWIVTIHDLNHLKFAGFPQRTYYERLLKPFALKAKGRVTVSEFSRQEIRAWLGPVELEIARNALDRRWLEPPPEVAVREALDRLGLERGKFFFCLSNPKSHKNVPLLLEAYTRLGAGALPLVLPFAPERRVPGVRVVSRLSDELCRALASACRAFLFPSKYEGFGLPPLEAAVAGAPILVADIPALREALSPVAQEAEWIPPEGADAVGAWSTALARATREPPKAIGMEGRRLLLETYSVEKLGLAMDRIYRRVLRLPV